MKTRNKIILAFITLCFTQLVSAQNAREFPYSMDLMDKKKHKDIVEASGSTVRSDRYTKDGLILTDTKGEKYAFALDKVSFKSTYGIVVSFDYAMYGGDTNGGGTGDGLSFFIFDQSAKFEIGSHGAGLGYAYRETDKGYESQRLPGLNGAYLGVGLDVYGGATKRDMAINERREGVPASDNFYAPSSIVVRGGALGGSNRYKGYPVLFSKTQNKKYDLSNFNTRAELDHKTGLYKLNKDKTYKNFNLRASDTKAVFNRLHLTLIPDGQNMLVTVKMETSKGEFHTILEEYKYRSSFKTFDKDGVLYDFTTSIPSSFKIGFSGSTGGADQVQIIKNVLVSLPYGPETPDVIIPYCYMPSGNKGKQVVAMPFEDAVFYRGTVSNPIPGNSLDHIDPSSFRFEDEQGKSTPTKHSYTQPGVGEWNYIYTQQKVTLTITNDNLKAGDYTVYFSALGKGKPFGNEEYRSRPTPITLRVEPGCEHVILINPSLSSPVIQ